MADFFKISTESTKKDVVEIYPNFIVGRSSDLMIRGGDFYAIWLEERGLWSTDEQDVIDLIDIELDEFYRTKKDSLGGSVRVRHMWDSRSGVIDTWHKYCQKQQRDSYQPLDDKLMFANMPSKKKDYASKRLAYPLEAGECPAYESLLSTLYTPAERQKIEWAIGAIVNGDSKYIQKFMVLYGAAGTGKSTVMHIIEQLFDGYYASFEAKVLGSSNNAFALESFKSNPLVAINHDGDLSRIEDNTRLNSLVSHEEMSVNEKFKSVYTNRFRSFLFIGSNKPVKITDGKSGLLRRLIDVTPSGNKLSASEYRRAMNQIPFELGAIAYHCREVYTQNPHRYDDYIPIAMLGASNDFYNYVLDSYHVFAKDDGTTLKAAWEMYKTYCDEAKVSYPASQRVFKEELRNYFRDYNDRVNVNDGTRLRSYYSGFRKEKFEAPTPEEEERPAPVMLRLDETKSILDEFCADFDAQYASETDKPTQKWEYVRTKLSALDTKRTHFLKLPENSGHIFIDFDLKDASGKKSLERNLIEAAKWPPTYAEISKGGAGVHLHYLYDGDASKLSAVYSDGIEVKVPKGNSSLRRRLSKCNALPITTINSGLPLKGEKKMVNIDQVKSENGLRTLIKRNLCKEFHAGTKPSMDFIQKILDDAYKSDLKYDVSDMKGAILAFAASSTNQADYCLKLMDKLQFKSKDTMEAVSNEEQPIVFFDVEVFPNLFLVNWKVAGEGKSIVRMINPTPQQIEELLKYRLVGFNCRRYDNHILYACLIGYNNQQLYELSQKIVTGSPNPFFGEAYNISYTDIYCFSSKKQSLKKFEIELGLHHKELGLPWDEPVPEARWHEVAEYCDNDVIATEATFYARKSDFLARQILADLAGMTVNDTTNTLTTRIIFGKNRNPQGAFNYRDMGDTSNGVYRSTVTGDLVLYDGYGDEYTVFDEKGQPIFPGYKYEFGKSTYRGEEVGEGGYVYAEPGIHTNIALLDIASMHPHSVLAEDLFGKEYTARFREIVDARISIKHKDFDKARKMLDGKLAKYLSDENVGDLATALKIAINSVYGLTMAGFDNPFRDKRNKDNIVAKRGALFMVNLKHFVQSKGFTVAHIKTDSIKIPNATPEIIQQVMDYGKQYGYTFEHEATYERMCLVNDAVYIAKYKDGKKAGKWTATGTQFAVPYVFKSLFSKEEIVLDDMCETKSVTGTIFLDLNETLPEGEHDYKFVGKVGQFCPMRNGMGGGILYREKDGKYYAVGGTKGYRWLESEMVREAGLDSQIDRTYYKKMVDKASETIAKYGDVEWFVSDNNVDDLPPWFAPGEPFGEDGAMFDRR